MCAKFGLVNGGPLLRFDDKDGGLDPVLFDGLYGELADCKLLVICSILLKGGAILDVGVLGPPFISNGSSFADELGFESINGDDKLLFPGNLAGRGDAADTFCGVRCEGGPCERCVGVVEPIGCGPDDNGLPLLFGVEVERPEGVVGSSLHDDDDGNGGPPPIPFDDRYPRFKCLVIINSSPSIPEKKNEYTKKTSKQSDMFTKFIVIHLNW